VGRRVAKDIEGLKKGDVITPEVENCLQEKHQTVRVFSPFTCRAEDGICKRCYGDDPSTKKPPKLGLPVGLLAAQSIGERATQDFMRAFHGVRPKILENIEAAKAFFEWGNLPSLLKYQERFGVAGELVGWLYAAYEGRVDPRHFEVVLRQMRVEDAILKGLVSATQERLSESFLSVIAFQKVTQQALQAAQRCLKDELHLAPAPLFLGIGSRPSSWSKHRRGEE
jgi:hypothetical protein